MDKLEYEEVELCKNIHQDKLSPMVDCCTDDEEDLGIYSERYISTALQRKTVGSVRETDY